MKKTTILLLTLLLHSFSYGQTATELYNTKDYKALVKLEKKADKLTAEELYMVGYAFFQLENDLKAVEFYDMAIAKDPENGSYHFYRGLSLRYLKQYDEALTAIEIAIQQEPTNQEFVNEKGIIFYDQGEMDKALNVFEEAIKLPNIDGEPFFWVARIYHEKEAYDTALAKYYEAAANAPKTSRYHLASLQTIGQLEYTHTLDNAKSAAAYAQVIAIDPTDYTYYTKLIKAYNGAKEFARADSIFNLMKIAYENKELSEDEMKFKNISIDEYEWNGQKMSVFKYLVDPKESLDLSYKVYLITKEGDKVERTFMVEQTLPLFGGVKHLLCEKDKKTGAHFTYPYGWKTDEIPLDDLKMAVGLILDGKMEPSASSNFGGN